MNPTKPGAYRAIFQKALTCLLQTEGTRMSQQELNDCTHYQELLDDPEFKFGKQTTTGQQQ